MIWQGLYNLLIWLALPFAFARLYWRGNKIQAYRQGWQQRLGQTPHFPVDQSPLWLHAVSVGEVTAATPLIEALLATPNIPPLLITTTTPTGAEQVHKHFASRVQHAYLPYDLPFAVRRFIKRSHPCMGIILETEIWPNLMHLMTLNNIPMVLANARLSARAFNRYGWVHGLMQPAMASFTTIATQTDPDAARFLALGMQLDQVQVLGNLKYDIALPDDIAKRGHALRQVWGTQRPCWVAASTHAGEEKIILASFDQLRQTHPDALLILVPRHPQRFEEVAKLCQAYAVARHSQAPNDASDCQVYLGDTLGDLLLFYAASDIAFIGGSLVKIGGHNPIEAALLKCPILTGPEIHNFTVAFDKLLPSQAAQIVSDNHQLAQTVGALIDQPERRQQLGELAFKIVNQETGAVQRHLQLIRALLAANL